MKIGTTLLTFSAVLISLGAAEAAPVNFDHISADAKWFAHADVDAMRKSTIVKSVYRKWAKKKGDAEEHFKKVQREWGLDPRSDLHSMTFYSTEFQEHRGVLIVHADVDRKLLLKKAEQAPGHKVTEYGDNQLHTWLKRDKGDEREVTGAFFKSDVIVFGSSVDRVKHALDVLQGAKPSLGKDSALRGEVLPGTTIIARAYGLHEADLTAKSPVVNNSKQLSVEMGEHEGTAFLQARLTAEDAETAQQVKELFEGARALIRLRSQRESEAADLLAKVDMQVELKGEAVSARIEGPADVILKVARKIKKKKQRIKERRKQE